MNSFWKAERTFEVHTAIHAPPDEVRELLSDPRAWIGLQPLLLGFEPDPDRPGHFRITENLRFFGISVRHRYRAKVVPHAEGVDSEAWSVPFIHLRNRLRWTSTGDVTRLHETVQVEAPRPLVGYVIRTAQPAHLTMLQRIGAAVEARAAARGRAA